MKYQILTLKFVITIITQFLWFPSNAQAYSDNELLTKGTEYYNQNNFRKAEVFLFAYVQKSPLRYLTDTKLKDQVQDALRYSQAQKEPRKQIQGAESDGKFDEVGEHPNKPSLHVQKPADFPGIEFDGTWTCNDGGTYYINKVGNKLWWFAESGGEVSEWSNVFLGTIEGNTVFGKWADVPFGKSRNSGELTIRIQSPGKFSSITRMGRFKGSEWILQVNQRKPLVIERQTKKAKDP